MKRSVSALLIAILTLGAADAAELSMTVVDRPATDSSNDHYVGTRPPLLPAPLIKLPIRAIEPRGWVRKQLQLQADGFHGHLGEISRFLNKEGNAWLNPDASGHSGWEEAPYWLKGFSNCAYLLRDEPRIAEAKVWIEAALASKKEDGWFGPESNRTRVNGAPDLWPNMIMLFCLQDYYDFAEDPRVIELMTAYFRYLQTIPDEQFLPDYWDTMRGGDLLFSVYWLYNRTGDSSLLELAQKVHRRTARWDEGVINWHNVNIGQGFGEPATWYLQSGRPADLQAAYRNWQKVREMYGQVPGGMFGGDENCRPGFTGPRQAVETCGMVEAMLSDEILLTITGDSLWADRCEDVAFNSLPAALTADIKALRYLTAPNLVLSDRHNKSPGLQNGGPMLHYNPHSHRCCQHNWGHGWPYFAEHLWMATPDNGLAAVFYAASEVTARVGDGAEVTIAERTQYPFEEQVSLTIKTAQPVEFSLYLRVPGWCGQPAVKIAGQASAVAGRAGAYLRIDRRWSDGDTVELTLPMQISLRTWTANMNSVSIDRGPLTYSLKIGERYVQEGGTEDWPAWEVHPTTPWNYGLVLDATQPAKSFEVVHRDWPADDMPFTLDGVPLELRARGKRIPQWQMDHLGLVGPLQPSPVISDEPAEPITLVPMGAARLRIASFPVIGQGPEATRWKEPAKPAFQVRASHCFDSDSVLAVADGLEPKDSNDHSIPRMTWWPRRGSQEWIEGQFDKARECSRVAVYWFDDTGVGQCRVPAGWKLLYREGQQWQPVRTEVAFETVKDRFNEVKFEKVKTDALRIEVQLQEEFSGGILEWQID